MNGLMVSDGSENRYIVALHNLYKINSCEDTDREESCNHWCNKEIVVNHTCIIDVYEVYSIFDIGCPRTLISNLNV